MATATEKPKPAEPFSMSIDEAKLILVYRRLSPEQKRGIRDALDKLLVEYSIAKRMMNPTLSREGA